MVREWTQRGRLAHASARSEGGAHTLTLAEAMQRALAALQQQDWAECEHLCRFVLGAQAGNFDALHLLGVVALNTWRPGEAVDLLLQATAVLPGHAEARNNLGAAFLRAGRGEEALASHDDAIRLRPDYAQAHNNRCVALHDLKRFSEAVAAGDRAVVLAPEYAEAWFNRGAALQALRRHGDAVESYEKAIALRSDYAEAMYNCGVGLQAQGRHAAAIGMLGRALDADPGCDFVYGAWLSAKLRICDWAGLDGEFARLSERVGGHERALTPQVVALPASAALQRRVLEAWTRAKHPSRDAMPATTVQAAGKRLHVGYFSADFHDHATCNLIAGLFELHDRTKFEITAFSFGPDRQDPMRWRVAAAFDRFIDVRDTTDAEVAALARSLGIDVAIDLKGHTEDARPGIFAERAAPVQAAYLGYPGTMGADYIDYIIADAVVIPDEHRTHYTEKVVWLPGSYQVNDSIRPISAREFTRVSEGLPVTGFVFCCFNANYKIQPDTFGQWMLILRAVEGSVLWLIEDNPEAVGNLRNEAARQGMDAARLVFAGRLAQPEHLARQRLADLVLDTLPCNAHTTTGDALWAGLPVLTCLGEAFAGRVAASLLHAVGLPELVVETPEKYEALAIQLANDPVRLGEIRARLARNRLAASLFDTRRFARTIETAYTEMHRRHLAGAAPDHLAV